MLRAAGRTHRCVSQLVPSQRATRLPPQLARSAPRRNLFVQTEETPNTHALKFYPGKPVLEKEKGTRDFPNLAAARASPLAKKLFRIEGVKGIFLSSDFITVNKDPDADWNAMKPQIYSDLMEFYAAGTPILLTDDEAKGPTDTQAAAEDSETVTMIKEIIDTRIRPAVMEDGGDIEYRGFKEGVVFLKMQGSCSGCSSAQVTLKGGIERMLTHWVPEVTNVMAVSDDDLEKINLDALNKVEQKLEKNADKV